MMEEKQNQGENKLSLRPIANCVALQPLIAKLGHSVEEIRVRALKNILFKLDHKLICAADLVHERQLLVKLLEWFNFPNCCLKREVLGILETLSKPVSGAENLLSIGAVEFLSHLRQDVDPELYQSIDNVIYQLLSLPQDDTQDHEHWCLYKMHEQEDVETVKSAEQQGRFYLTFGPVGSVQREDGGELKPVSTQTPSTSVNDDNCSLPGWSHVNHAGRCFNEQFVQTTCQEALSLLHTQSTHTIANSQESVNKCRKASLSFFQWLSLSASDRHILSVTASRLQSHSSSLVSKSCEFLMDVLFKDFPAEIFLHRPTVLQALLELVEDKVPVSQDLSLTLSAMKCLCDFCQHLHVRLAAISDPVVFCPDQDCWKYQHQAVTVETMNQATEHLQVSNVRENGDGGVDSQDQSSSLSENKASIGSAEDEDEMLTEALQFSQLSVEEFCMIVLSRVIPMCQGALSINLTTIETAVNLLHEVLHLLKKVLPVNLWQNGTQFISLLGTSLKNIMKSLAESVMHHIKQYSSPEASRENGSKLRLQLPTHRMAAVSVASFLVLFLEALVPVDVASQVVPPDVTTVLWFLIVDELLALTHVHLRPILTKYLAVLDPNAHRLGLFAQEVCESMKNTCKFVKASRMKEKHSLKYLLDLAEKSVISVTFHKHMEFISEALKLCSRICDPVTQANSQTVSVSHKTTLQLLAHPDPDVRLQSYKVCLTLLRDAFSVSHVTEPLSKVCQRALFLLDRAVLHQICCFGIYDEVKTVNTAALELITTLLLGRLSMSGELWKKLLDGLIASLPQLQGCIQFDPTLSQCILELAASNGVTGAHVAADGDIITLPALERFRGALRLMFINDPQVRNKAFAYVMWNLTNEASSEKRKICVGGSWREDSADMFIVDQLTCVVHAHVPGSHSSVGNQELLQLWSILSSSSLDVALRKSSAQHLAIILQDPQWHPPLLEEHSDEVCLSILKEILDKDADEHSLTTPSPRVELVPPCLTILRLLAEYSVPCRHKLAQSFSTYSLVIRCAFLCHSNGQATYETACLMALMLFDEAAVAVPDSSNRIPFSLPKSLLKRFQFPFSPPVYNPVSVHQLPGINEKDSLTSEPAVSMLRLAWNLGWHESVENLSRVKGIEDTGQTLQDLGYWPDLQWRSVDADLLRCSHVATALTAQLKCMESAGSHHDVMRSLNKISTHLVVDKGVMQAAAKQRLAVDVLFSLRWENSFERYLQVIPNSSDDDSLLIEVLKVLDSVLSGPRAPPEPVVAWVARAVLQRDGPQMTLLRNVQNSAAGSQTVSESKRALRKHLLSFLVTLVKCLSQYTKGWRLGRERVFVGDLAHALALNLDLADNPQFYDLPVLETSLICLAHITAQPHWSLHCRATQGMGLCLQLLTSLVQVVLAFHAGRLGAHLSFMGKGVTYYASLCLVHVTHELAVIDPSQAWVSHWVQEKQSADAHLPWLVPLLTDRWPEVRWMGLAICTSLANSAHGREELELVGQRFAGGLWNVVFSVVLDDMECAVVRQQAALLLCSLTNGLVPTQNPTDVKSQNQNISMNIQILISLVERLKFFSRLSSMLSNGTLPLTVHQGSSKACQSSASMSVSSETNTDIPYKPLGSASWSGSVSSEAQNTTADSTNGQVSPGGLSGLSHTTSTILSTVSSSAGETQPSRTPTSSMPLIIERGLPSGMSNTSSSDVSSWEGSTLHSRGSSLPVVKSSVTPGLIGAVAQVLHNLVLLAPERIIPALNKTHIIRDITLHLECSDVNRYLDTEYQFRSSSQHRAASVVISQILVMYCNIVTLLRCILHVDTTFCFNLLQDSETLDKIVSLLAINTPAEDETVERFTLMMWESVSRLLLILLQKQGHLSVPSVAEEILYSHWNHFTRVFKRITMADKSSTVPSLKNSLLKLLGLLVTFEGKRHSAKRARSEDEHIEDRPIKNSLVLVLDDGKGELFKPEVDSLNGVNKNEDCNTSASFKGCLSFGSELCSVLLGVYDAAQPLGSAVMDEERNLVAAVLSSLLAVSQSAKNTALQAGLIETALERIKHLHVQLNMHSLQLGKGPLWKKKDDPLIIELVKVLQLLRNFVFRRSQIKAACLECGIVDVLHKLWSWCTVEVPLLVEVLRLLCTLTAHFTKASALLAGSSGVAGSLSRAAQSGSTFLHSLIKMTNKTNSKLQNNSSPDLETHLQTHKTMFSLLSNLVWSVECRGVMWKTNFLLSFSSIKPLNSCSHPKQRSVTRAVLLSWLSLLVNITFFNDGQQGVVKSAGSIQVLVELCSTQHRQLRDRALLVLRNLCFHSASKPVLFGNGKLLALLVDSIADNSTYVRALSLSALCSLLYNCQKAKVSLKKAGIVKKAEEAKFQTANEQSTDKYNKMCCESLEILQKILLERR